MPMFDFRCEVCGQWGREWRAENPPRFCGNNCRLIGMQGQPCKRENGPLTDRQKEDIRRAYMNGTGRGEVRDLCKALRLPRWKVRRAAVRMGLVDQKKKEPPWSEEELRHLERFARYHEATIRRKLSERGFHRTETAIVLKLRRMRFRQNLSGYSATSLALCMGVDPKTIIRAVNLGKLPAKRRGTGRTERNGGDMYWITEDGVKRYVLDNLPEIDIRKVDKYWFVDLLTGEAGRET